MDFPHVDYFDYKLFGGNPSNIAIDRKLIINTINQYSFCIAEKDEDFKKALQASDILLPDGIGVVWSNLIINRNKVKKIAGADMHESLLKKLNKEGGKCFYLGASELTLNLIKERLEKEYPNIKYCSFSPPYKNEFSNSDNYEMISRINEFKPDVLFVGMTAPKQEKWVYQNRKAIDSNIICSIGAVFDFYAGTVKRPNVHLINAGLEWLGRFIIEPKRMWKRYFYYGPVFLSHTLIEKYKASPEFDDESDKLNKPDDKELVH